MYFTKFTVSPSVLSDAFRNRLKDHLFSDLFIRTADGRELAAHRLILAAASPAIKKAILELDLETSVTLILPDFKHEDVESILPFLYGGYNKESAVQSQPNADLLKCLQIGVWDKWTSVRGEIEIKTKYLSEKHDNKLYLEEVVKQNRRQIKSDQIFEFVNCEESITESDHLKNHFYKCVGETSAPDCLASGKVKGGGAVKKKGRQRKYFEADGGWKCQGCLQFFPQRNLIKTHFQKCRKEIFEGGAGVRCGVCPAEFNGEDQLRKHVEDNQLQHQSPQADSITFDEVSSGEFTKNLKTRKLMKRQKEFACHLCRKKFEYAKNLSNHVKRHDLPPKTEFKCSQCDQIFGNKSTLHYHVAKHSKPSHQCDVCPRMFKSARGLRYHTSLHDGIADFLCDDCGRGFVTRQKLLNHRRSKHTFEKPYICDQCGRGFTRSDKMVVHKRRAHTGEKPYECELCQWRGVDSSSLIHHRKKHVNELLRKSNPDTKEVIITPTSEVTNIADVLALYNPSLQSR